NGFAPCSRRRLPRNDKIFVIIFTVPETPRVIQFTFIGSENRKVLQNKTVDGVTQGALTICSILIFVFERELGVINEFTRAFYLAAIHRFILKKRIKRLYRPIILTILKIRVTEIIPDNFLNSHFIRKAKRFFKLLNGPCINAHVKVDEPEAIPRFNKSLVLLHRLFEQINRLSKLTAHAIVVGFGIQRNGFLVG